MTSLARIDARPNDAPRISMPSAIVLPFPAAAAALRPALKWMLNPATGQLIQCWTMSDTGPKTAKLFG